MLRSGSNIGVVQPDIFEIDNYTEENRKSSLYKH